MFLITALFLSLSSGKNKPRIWFYALTYNPIKMLSHQELFLKFNCVYLFTHEIFFEHLLPDSHFLKHNVRLSRDYKDKYKNYFHVVFFYIIEIPTVCFFLVEWWSTSERNGQLCIIVEKKCIPKLKIVETIGREDSPIELN